MGFLGVLSAFLILSLAGAPARVFAEDLPGSVMPNIVPPSIAMGASFSGDLNGCQAARDAAFRQSIASAMGALGNSIGGGGMTSGGGVVSTINQGLGAFGGAMMGVDAPCPPEGSTTAGNVSCEQLVVGGQYNPGALSAHRERLNNALLALACKRGKLNAMQAEMGCLSNQAKNLAAWVNSLRGVYAQNIAAMRRDTDTFTALVEDRKAQQAEVNALLGGGGTPGDVGLLAMKTELEGKLAASGEINSKITSMREVQKNFENDRKTLDEEIQNRQIALSNECFSTKKNPSYHCQKNGPAVTAREYVLCRFEQNQYLNTEDGTLETDQTTANRAAARKGDLDQLLNNILGEAPTTAKVSGTPGEAANVAVADQNRGILTVADIESQYGEDLAKFNGKGLNIEDFLLREMGRCFSSARSRVEREKRNATSSIGKRTQELKKAERNFAQDAGQQIDEWARLYAKGTTALTKNEYPVNTTGCKGVRPNIQLGCMEEMRDKLQGLLTGSSPNSVMNITIKGRGTQTGTGVKIPTAIPIECAGLNGCVTKLQNTSRGLGTLIQQTESTKAAYVQRANKSVDDFTATVAMNLSPQSQMLTDSIKRMNTVLAGMGVSSSIDMQAVTADPLKKGKDDLYDTPTNMVGLVGDQMNPKLLNLSENTFSNSLKGVADAAKENDRKFAEAQASFTELDTKASQCRTQAAQQALAALRTAVGELGTANCAMIADWCSSSYSGGWNDMRTTINGIPSGGGVSQDDIDGILRTGSSACTRRPASGSFADQTTRANSGACITQIDADIASTDSALSAMEPLITGCYTATTSTPTDETGCNNAGGTWRAAVTAHCDQSGPPTLPTAPTTQTACVNQARNWRCDSTVSAARCSHAVDASNPDLHHCYTTPLGTSGTRITSVSSEAECVTVTRTWVPANTAACADYNSRCRTPTTYCGSSSSQASVVTNPPPACSAVATPSSPTACDGAISPSACSRSCLEGIRTALNSRKTALTAAKTRLNGEITAGGGAVTSATLTGQIDSTNAQCNQIYANVSARATAVRNATGASSTASGAR